MEQLARKTNPTKALIFGDVSLNIIDGSSIWLASTAGALAQVFDEVHVLLKAPIENKRLIKPLKTNPKIHIHPHSTGVTAQPLSPRYAAQRLATLNQDIEPHAIIVRGSQVCAFVSSNPHMSKKLWAYVTDLPFPPSSITAKQVEQLRKIAGNSYRMFAQTESARSYLESICPEACGKTVLLPPMVPDEFFEPVPKPTNRELTLIYSGKFARAWNTLEMLLLPEALKEKGVHAKLIMVGDKFQKDPKDPTWHIRMKNRLQELAEDPSSGVIWKGGLPRAEAIELVGQADLGLSWRDPEMDASLELSTKLLEYSAAGTAVIANRCSQHEALFGTDYPLLTSSVTSTAEIAQLISTFTVEDLHKHGSENRNKVGYYSYKEAVRRFKDYFAPVLDNITSVRDQPLKVAIASHDLKFMGDIINHLQANPSYQISFDSWHNLHTNDEAHSLSIVEESDVIICEWCGPNALWYSKHKKPGQKLIVRLHRFEVNGPWMHDIDFSNIDHLVFVSEFQKEQTFKQLGELPAQNIHVIHNSIDVVDLTRPKAHDARFHLGVLGFVPYLKRPDRALDLLEKLLETDDRYYLHFRGRQPWEFPHEWNNPVQQQLYLQFYDRIRTTPALQDHVIFDAPGADVANWFRKIGFILSPSSYESFHLATAEGMASGAYPIVWDRPGASSIFSEKYVLGSIEEMATAILSLNSEEQQTNTMLSVQLAALQWDNGNVLPLWDLLLSTPQSTTNQLPHG